MTERVRVTGPPRRSREPLPRASDLDTETQLGSLYLGSLMRAQLGLAVRILTLLMLGVGSLPLVFDLFPALTRLAVAGVPIVWLLLGGVVYPFLFLLGWHYVRRAEQNEESFTALLDRADEP